MSLITLVHWRNGRFIEVCVEDLFVIPLGNSILKEYNI